MRILDCGNCRAVETVEKRTACFSTVPTALGKLGKTAPSFPQFPPPLLLALKKNEPKQPVAEPESKIEWTLPSQRRKKSPRPGAAPMAGFEVTIHGRF